MRPIPVMSAPSRRRVPALLSDVYGSFALLAGMQLDLFTPLADGPAYPADLAARLDVDEGRLTRLLRALAAWDLVETLPDGRIANSAEAEKCLVRGRPGYLGGAHEAFSTGWRACLTTAGSVRTGRPGSPLDFASDDTDAIVGVLRGLAPQAAASAQELLALCDLSDCRQLLDVAGGSGALAACLCRALPQLQAQIVELPQIAPAARRLLDEQRQTGAGEIDRVSVIAADAVAGPLPGDQDVVVMRFFLQVLSPTAIAGALRQAWQALRSGGRLAILGYVLDDDGKGPSMALGADLLFLNYYQEGAAYTETEYRGWLADAGFIAIERRPMRGGLSAVIAGKP